MNQKTITAWFLVSLLGITGLSFPQVLLVENREDIATRKAAIKRLGKGKMDICLKQAGPKELMDSLNGFLDKGPLFLLDPRLLKDRDIDPIDLKLKSVSPFTILKVIMSTTDLRFVWRAGIVWITHKEDVREYMFLKVYDLRSMFVKIKNFPGPRLGIRLGEEEEAEGETDSGTVSGFDPEGLAEFIKNHVDPDSWESGSNASITIVSGGIFLIRQTESNQNRIKHLLQSLGMI